MIKDQNCFLIKIKKLNLYIIELNKNNTIKVKNYVVDCVINSKKCHLIIIITYNMSFFFCK